MVQDEFCTEEMCKIKLLKGHRKVPKPVLSFTSGNCPEKRKVFSPVATICSISPLVYKVFACFINDLLR